MADQDRFEDFLVAALNHYADEAPERTRLDLLASSVTARPQHRGLVARLTGGSALAPSFGASRPALGLLWLLLAVALLASVAAGVVVVGGLHRGDDLSVVPSPAPHDDDTPPRLAATEQPPSLPPALWVAYTVVDFTADTTYGIRITDPSGQTRSLAATPDDGIWRMCPQFSPSGRHLAHVETARQGSEGAPTQDWVLVVSEFDAASGSSGNEQRWPIRSGYPDCGAWSSNGSTYAYPSPQGSLTLLDVATRSSVDMGAPVGRRLTWSPDGGEIASIEDDGVHIRSLDTGGDRVLMGHGDHDFSWVVGLSWSPDGTLLAVSGVRYGSVLEDDALRTGDDSEFILVVTHQGAIIDEVVIERNGMRGPNVGGETLTMGPVWSPDSRSIAYGTSMRPFRETTSHFGGELRTHRLRDGRETIIDPGDSLEGPGLAWIDNEWLLVVGRDSIQLHATSQSAGRVVLAESLPDARQELLRGTSLNASYAWAISR